MTDNAHSAVLKFLDELEPTVATMVKGNLRGGAGDTSNIAQLSMAMSLKRIADSLSILQGASFERLTNDITHLAWEAGRNFQHGMKTDR